MIHRQRGFSYMEILVAVVVLAICALPLGRALRNGVAASSIAAAKARELRCIRNTMELVRAEPYANLYAAAAGIGKPATFTMPGSFSLPADDSCDAPPLVSIARYEPAAGKAIGNWIEGDVGTAQPESPLLHITVTAADNGYAFTTLVAR